MLRPALRLMQNQGEDFPITVYDYTLRTTKPFMTSTRPASLGIILLNRTLVQ
jgi:hypothetical protein